MYALEKRQLIALHVYQGSRPPPGPTVARLGFAMLVLCGMAGEYDAPPVQSSYPGTVLVHCPLDDAELTLEEFRRAQKAARLVAQHVRAGLGDVLVTCMQGRNRSGLVVVLALHMLTGHSGRSLVSLVRERRKTREGPALANPSFASLLDTLPSVRHNVPGYLSL